MAYTALTLADLKVLLADRTDHVRFWTDREARLAWNEALRDWNLLTGAWRRRVIYPSVAFQTEYALGATLTYGMAAKINGLPLIKTAIWDLDLGRPSWRGETIASGGDVPTVPTIWAPISLQQIAIWPALTTSLPNVLTVDGISATPVLEEDADFVDLNDAHVDVLTEYALHILTFKQGGPTWRATKPAFTAFLQAAADENGRLKANQAFRRAAQIDLRPVLRPTKGMANQLDQLAEER